MGCHSGSVTSRDHCDPETFESLDACRRAVAKAEENWKRVGSNVWYANATGPNGETVTLHEGTPYR